MIWHRDAQKKPVPGTIPILGPTVTIFVEDKMQRERWSKPISFSTLTQQIFFVYIDGVYVYDDDVGHGQVPKRRNWAASAAAK